MTARKNKIKGCSTCSVIPARIWTFLRAQIVHKNFQNPRYSTFRWGGDRRSIENHYLASIPKIEVSFIDMKSAVRGQQLNIEPNRIYICRLKESPRGAERHSDFWVGIYGIAWVESMDNLSKLAEALMSLKPQKRLYSTFQLHEDRLLL